MFLMGISFSWNIKDIKIPFHPVYRVFLIKIFVSFYIFPLLKIMPAMNYLLFFPIGSGTHSECNVLSSSWLFSMLASPSAMYTGASPVFCILNTLKDGFHHYR